MENIIKELLGIEDRAKDIAHVSRAKVTELQTASAKRTEDALAAIAAETGVTIEERRIQDMERNTKNLAAVSQELEARLASLMRYYGDNRESIARMIFEAVLAESP